MRKTFLILTVSAALLSGCAWETYQDGNGKTAVRQKYPAGTPVYYQDGSYSKNMNYNQYRPERRAVLPDQTGNNADEEHRQHWSFKTDKPTLCRLKPLQTAWHRKTLCRKTL